jgi:hypothetical protein
VLVSLGKTPPPIDWKRNELDACLARNHFDLSRTDVAEGPSNLFYALLESMKTNSVFQSLLGGQINRINKQDYHKLLVALALEPNQKNIMKVFRDSISSWLSENFLERQGNKVLLTI